jgi:Domain of unknown function (DUF4218)
MFLRYMYPFERAMGQLEGLVRSRSRPERSTVEGYITEDVIDFYTSYLERVEPIGLPKSRHDGRLQCVGIIKYKLVTVGLELRQKTYLKVLQHLAVVAPYVNELLTNLRENNPFKGEISVINEHNIKFIKWFTDRVNSQIPEIIDETIKVEFKEALGQHRAEMTTQFNDLFQRMLRKIDKSHLYIIFN